MKSYWITKNLVSSIWVDTAKPYPKLEKKEAADLILPKSKCN